MQASIERVAEDSSGYPVTVQWVDKMRFVGSDDCSHSILIDTLIENGGDNSGPTPAKLMLMALAACTSMDVVSILAKSRQKVTSLSVSARGVQNSEYPKYYKEVQLYYNIKGQNLDVSRVERAIKLSEEKYCSVGATISGKAKILIKYKIESNRE
jgi:putative redox protein